MLRDDVIFAKIPRLRYGIKMCDKNIFLIYYYVLLYYKFLLVKGHLIYFDNSIIMLFAIVLK